MNKAAVSLLLELSRGARLAFSNAQELFGEGQLLLANGSLNRALTLHQISLEECQESAAPLLEKNRELYRRLARRRVRDYGSSSGSGQSALEHARNVSNGRRLISAPTPGRSAAARR
jgi:hypothetical protein